MKELVARISEPLRLSKVITSMAELSTVLPGDSASQSGDSLAGTASSTGAFVGVVAESALKAYTVMDRSSYQQYLKLLQASVGLADKEVGVQCGALRCASRGSSQISASSRSTGGSTSGGFAGRLVGGGKSRISSIRRTTSWRPAKVPDGLCYTKFLSEAAGPSVSVKLGQWPSLSSILDLPFQHFQSFQELERFKLVGDSSTVHVKAGGNDGFSMVSSMARVAQGYKSVPGSFGAVLRSMAVDQSGGLRLGARTMVGGSGYPNRSVGLPHGSFERRDVATASFRFAFADLDEFESVVNGLISSDLYGFGDTSARLVFVRSSKGAGRATLDCLHVNAFNVLLEELRRVFGTEPVVKSTLPGAGFSVVPSSDAVLDAAVVAMFGRRVGGWRYVDTLPEGDCTELPVVDETGRCAAKICVFYSGTKFCGISAYVGDDATSLKWPLMINSVSTRTMMQCLRDGKVVADVL